jgi:hypothetical protein
MNIAELASVKYGEFLDDDDAWSLLLAAGRQRQPTGLSTNKTIGPLIVLTVRWTLWHQYPSINSPLTLFSFYLDPKLEPITVCLDASKVGSK